MMPKTHGRLTTVLIAAICLAATNGAVADPAAPEPAGAKQQAQRRTGPARTAPAQEAAEPQAPAMESSTEELWETAIDAAERAGEGVDITAALRDLERDLDETARAVTNGLKSTQTPPGEKAAPGAARTAGSLAPTETKEKPAPALPEAAPVVPSVEDLPSLEPPRVIEKPSPAEKAVQGETLPPPEDHAALLHAQAAVIEMEPLAPADQDADEDPRDAGAPPLSPQAGTAAGSPKDGSAPDAARLGESERALESFRRLCVLLEGMEANR